MEVAHENEQVETHFSVSCKLIQASKNASACKSFTSNSLFDMILAFLCRLQSQARESLEVPGAANG